MNIDIPAKTVVQMLQEDLKNMEADYESHTADEGSAEKFYLLGKVHGLSWAIKNLELNK